MTAYSISVFSHGIYSSVAQNIEKPKTAIRTGIAEKENRSELSPFQSRFTRIIKYFIYKNRCMYLQLATTLYSKYIYFVTYMRRVLLHRCETIKLQEEDIILRGYENVS